VRYELLVGLRYTRAKRRNHFISFISLISMAGMALGVAALIVVLSVMNGFQEELRNRILAVASHIEIRGLPTLADDAEVARVALMNPRVKAAAPYVLGQAMLSAGDVNRGALVRGTFRGRLPRRFSRLRSPLGLGGSGSGFSLQLSRDPGQSLLYLMDGTNMRVWILRRSDLKILDRFGRVPVLRASAGTALVGLLIVVFGPTLATAMAGTVLWGLGTALGFPVGMSAAADDPRYAAGRVSVVATIGYVAFLAGPPLVGLIGNQAGVLRALTVTAGMLSIALLVVGSTRPISDG